LFFLFGLVFASGQRQKDGGKPQKFKHGLGFDFYMLG
jgi:hypothetical protein